jgi:hypothetical protein
MASIVWELLQKQGLFQLQLDVDGLCGVETRAQRGFEHIPNDSAISTPYWEDSKRYPRYI